MYFIALTNEHDNKSICLNLYLEISQLQKFTFVTLAELKKVYESRVKTESYNLFLLIGN